jgi:hypothetical protein
MGFRHGDHPKGAGKSDWLRFEEDKSPEGPEDKAPPAGVNVQLVRDHVSRDLLQTCVQLLEAVQEGHITGLAFACSMKGKKYFVNVSGALATDPTYARGVVAALDDELSRMVQGRADADTTQ